MNQKEENMKKRILALLMCATMVFGLVACGGGSSDDGANNDGAADKIIVGLATDVGGVNDGSFNQSAWEGLHTPAANGKPFIKSR